MIGRRIRAVIGNAVVWGTAWGLASMVVYVLLRLTGLVTENTSFLNMVGIAIRVGVVGALTSTVFSFLIATRYRGRRLSELSWLPFSIGGAGAASVFVLGFMFVMRVLSGDVPLMPHDWLMDAAMAAGFGGLAAGSSLKLAQYAEKQLGAGQEGTQRVIGE